MQAAGAVLLTRFDGVGDVNTEDLDDKCTSVHDEVITFSKDWIRERSPLSTSKVFMPVTDAAFSSATTDDPSSRCAFQVRASMDKSEKLHCSSIPHCPEQSHAKKKAITPTVTGPLSLRRDLIIDCFKVLEWYYSS